MKRLFISILFLWLFITSASAFSVELSSGLEAFFPLNPDLYGKTLINNNWPDYVRSEFDWRSGEDRVHLFTPNSYDRLFSFYIAQRANFGTNKSLGWGIELSERFRWLLFAPAKDVDILFERQEIPISLVPFVKILFGKFDTIVGAGGSAVYHTTQIFGKDFYKQEENPFYDPNDEESEEPKAIYDSQRFGRSAWSFGWMAKVGFGYNLKNSMRLSLDIEYSSFSLESLEAKIVDDDPEKKAEIAEYHWKEKTLKGDAGGISVILGVSYILGGGE